MNHQKLTEKKIFAPWLTDLVYQWTDQTSYCKKNIYDICTDRKARAWSPGRDQAAGSLGSSFNMMGVLGWTNPLSSSTIGIYEKKNCVTTEGQQPATHQQNPCFKMWTEGRNHFSPLSPCRQQSWSAEGSLPRSASQPACSFLCQCSSSVPLRRLGARKDQCCLCCLCWT